MKKLSLASLVIILALCFAVPTTAQDMPKKATKQMEMKEKGSLKQVSCDPACGFMIQSRDEKEIVSAVKHHAKAVHKMDMTDKEIKAKMKEVAGQ